MQHCHENSAITAVYHQRPECAARLQRHGEYFSFLLFTVQSSHTLFLEALAYLPFLPLSCKIRSAYLRCVYVSRMKKSQSHDQHWHICASSFCLIPLPSFLLFPRAFCFSSPDERHCVHPNWITCHTIFLILTHSLPSHLSLSSRYNVYPPSCTVAAGEKSVHLFQQLFPPSSPFLTLLNLLSSFYCFPYLRLPLFSSVSPPFWLLSSSLCLPNVVLIMEKERVQPDSMN